MCELEWVLAQTGDPKLAMDFIGDTDLRVMQRYLKRRDDRLIALARSSTPRKVPPKCNASRRGERWPEKSEQRHGKSRATGRI